MNKITYYGSEKDITKAVAVIKKQKSLLTSKESKVRLRIQRIIDEKGLKATILVNDDPVWSKKRILTNLKRIMKIGTLYNENQKKPPILSHYFYAFLHQVCGSVAHYDIHGWIHRYPTINHLKKFFKKNEFSKRVRDWIPASKTDARAIIEAIETKLFPFKTYIKTKK